MRKIFIAFCCVALVSACDKHDPILPGARTAIFDTSDVKVLNKTISDVPSGTVVVDNSACPYTQDSKNIIWDGERRIFSGFATDNSVATTQRPICSGKYIYAGLTTGEVLKINPKTRQIAWIADVYRASNLTGGASMVDIVAPIVPVENAVYAGGLGDAFCRLNAASGDKKWCVEIGVATSFIIADNYAFVVATDNNLYAISTSDGAIYWRSGVKSQVAPTYQDGKITVGKMVFDVTDGKNIK